MGKFIKENKISSDKYRVFCFPYAGGAASVYSSWEGIVKERIYTIQLPGRENRIQEKLYTNMEGLVEDLYGEIKEYIDVPYCFFGHSLGGKIAYELIRKIQEEKGKSPEFLCVSACGVPSIKEKTNIHTLSDDELIKVLPQYTNIPLHILRNKNLMELFLPRIRADFKISEEYYREEEVNLNIPIIAIGGKYDKQVNLQSIRAWNRYTEKFELHLLERDHMYLEEEKDMIVDIIERTFVKIVGN